MTNVEMMEDNENLTFEQATMQAKAIVVHGDRINEALIAAANEGASEEDQDKILREWVKKDFCVFARTTPAQSKSKTKYLKLVSIYHIYISIGKYLLKMQYCGDTGEGEYAYIEMRMSYLDVRLYKKTFLMQNFLYIYFFLNCYSHRVQDRQGMPEGRIHRGSHGRRCE